MKLPILAIALFGYQINVADPFTFNQDRPLSTFENFYVSQIYQPTMNPSFLGPRIVETRQLRRATRPRQISPTHETQEMSCQTRNDIKKTINFKFINNTDTSAYAHIYIGQIKDNIGSFDYKLDAHSQKTFVMKDLYSLPVNINNYTINKRFNILDQTLPNKLTIVIPNQKDQTFDIEQGSYTVIVSSIDKAITVQVRKNRFI